MTRGELILESLLNGDYLTAREVIGESLAEDSTDYIQHVAESAQLDESGYGLQDLSEDLIGEYFGLNENEDDELADMSRDLVEEYLTEMPVVRGSSRYHDKRQAIDPTVSNKLLYKSFDDARKTRNKHMKSKTGGAQAGEYWRGSMQMTAKEMRSRKKAGKWDRISGHQDR